jgi:hypothetical protein
MGEIVQYCIRKCMPLAETVFHPLKALFRWQEPLQNINESHIVSIHRDMTKE